MIKVKKFSDVVRNSLRGGLLLIIVATLVLEATSLVQYYFSREGLREEAALRAESQLDNIHDKIMDVVDQAEAAVRNSVWIASWCLDVPDSLKRVCYRVVDDNPVVAGSAIALVPKKGEKLFCPYVYRSPDGLVYHSLDNEEYYYPSKEWFTMPIEIGEGYWSEPYWDEGGGEMLMTTYSVPIKDKNDNLAAVLTADVSLDWMTEIVGSLQVYPTAFSMVFSRDGTIMVCSDKSLFEKKNISGIVSQMEDTKTLSFIGKEVTEGRSGSKVVKDKGKKFYVHYAPVQKTRWSIAIVIPEDEIFGDIRQVGFYVLLMQIIGLLMLAIILYFIVSNLLKYRKLTEIKEKMEGELKIASGIQMSMVPKTFPPFPERHDLDMSALIVPAKEVGGDLYDFFIREEKLYFCIGDVSGKGIPASLVMAVTRSMFRAVASREASPGIIVSRMNKGMSDMNESNMFVTFFLGVLDLTNGHLRFCNAGHNAPMILTDAIRELKVEPNLPLGVLPDFFFTEQDVTLEYDDALFLYTDGLTEAENINHEQFGEQRTKDILHGRKTADEHLKNIRGAVDAFVGEAPQSDDLTMLFIHYLGKSDSNSSRHLILQNDTSQISKLAGFVEAVCESRQLSPDLSMSLNLAIEEAVTNVILYAYPEGTKGYVDIEAQSEEDSLVFIISDSGKAFDPTSIPPADVTASLEDRKIGGLGIFLVRNIMDEVSYERIGGKNVLKLKKSL